MLVHEKKSQANFKIYILIKLNFPSKKIQFNFLIIIKIESCRYLISHYLFFHRNFHAFQNQSAYHTIILARKWQRIFNKSL